IKKQIQSKAIVNFNNTFLWLFPIELIQAFNEIDVLTFMFGSSHLKGYLDMYHMNYSIYHINNGLLVKGQQNLSVELLKIIDLVDIYDGKLNDIGNKLTALSCSWWKKQNKTVKNVAERNAYNFLYNIYNAPADEAMWTKIKAGTRGKLFLNYRHYSTSFCPCNACATNKYRDKKYLAYLVNVYDNPVVIQWFRQNGVQLNENEFALSQLVQWLWRSAIRDGEKVYLYLPSIRMRTILTDFLKGGDSSFHIT
ncbi:MAG: hypothetical protein GXY98_07630, partial [Erysipelothrix sp.]|nr:hypothetical protein [Erysipelothrix sp.]